MRLAKHFILTIINVVGPIKGHLRVSKKGDNTKFAMFSISDINNLSDQTSESFVLILDN